MPFDSNGKYISPIDTFWQESKQARVRTPDELAFRQAGNQVDALSPPSEDSGPSDVRPGESEDFVENHPIFTSIMRTLTDPIHSFMDNTTLGQGLSRLSRDSAGIATGGASEIGQGDLPTTGNKYADTALDFLSMIPGTIANPGGLPSMGNVMGKAGDVAENLFQKAIPDSVEMAPLFNKVANSYVKTAGSFVPFEVANQLADTSDKSISERLGDIAENSALGGLLGPAGTLIGEGLKKTPVADWLNNAIERLTKPSETPIDQSLPTEPIPTENVSHPNVEGVNTPVDNPIAEPTIKEFKVGDVVTPVSEKGDLLTENPVKITDVAEKDGQKFYQVEGSNTYFPESQIKEPFNDIPTNDIKPNIETPTEQPSFKIDNPLPHEDGVRQHTETLANSTKADPTFIEKIKNDIRSRYTKVSNEETVRLANERVKNMDDAHSFVMSADRANPDIVATGHRLIDEYQKLGEFNKAVDVAEKIAELGTKAGQSIQAYSIYNRLTPEGLLVHTTRKIKRINDNLPAGAKEVKLTNDMAAQLKDLAGTVQDMKGTSQSANNVLSILERAKKGEKLNDIETQQIKNFIQDAKKFVKDDQTPKVKTANQPKEMQDKRVRDKVVDTLKQQEEAARQRIQAARNRISSTPFDIYADYAIIGASKLAQGVVKFSDWAEQMVKEAGEGIRPHLEKLYSKANELLSSTSKKVSQDTISNAERIAEKAIKQNELSPEDADAIRHLVTKVNGLAGDAKTMALQDLQELLQNKVERPTFGQKVGTLQTIAQLWNMKTQVRNILGNELGYRAERLATLVSVPIDWAKVNLFRVGERSVTFSTGSTSWNDFFFGGWKDFGKGLKHGWKAGWRGVNPDGLTTQFDLHGSAFNNERTWKITKYTLGFFEKSLGAVMRGFDYAAYNRAVNDSLGRMATLDAINRGLKGEAKKAHIEQFMRTADENIRSIADQYGKYVTYQDDNLLSKSFVGFKQGLNKLVPLAGKDFGLGDLVLKYPKTPANILMRAIEYSPAGFLRSALMLSKPLWDKSYQHDTAAIMMGLSRAITGTAGFTGMGYYLASKGIITGADSKDKDIRDLEKMSGGGQYRVNITALKRWVMSGFKDSEATRKTGDELVSYDWMQPISIAISMGANIAQNKGKKMSTTDKGMDLGKTVYDSINGAANTLVQQSLLQGIQKAFDTSPQSNGPLDKMTDILSDLPTSFMPSALNEFRQLNDNKSRITYDPNFFQQMANKLKNRIPGMSQSLPVEYDSLGHPKQVIQGGKENTPMQAFDTFINPSYTGKYTLSPEAKKVVDLINQTGNESIAPRSVTNHTIEIKGNKYQLTPQELSQLQQITGQETEKGLQHINPDANTQSNLQRITEILKQAGERARRSIELNHPEIQRQRRF